MNRNPLRLTYMLAVAAALLPSLARADLAGDIDAVLADKLLKRAGVSVEIVRLGESPANATVLYEHESHEPRIPASNLKLITTGAALDRLGPTFKFRTTLLKHGEDLVFVGDGDPTLGDAELLKKVGWSTTTVFEAWAKQLKDRGISTVRDVIVDDGVFDQTFVNPHWPADQEHKRYVAGVGGINLNANCVDFIFRVDGGSVNYFTDPATKYIDVHNTCIAGRKNEIFLSRKLGTNKVILKGEAVGGGPFSVTVDDPPMFAGTVLSESLDAAGIKTSGSVKRDASLREQREKAMASGGEGWTIIGVHETPISTVLARANKDSMNLYAESLCKRLGYDVTHKPGSWDNGTAAVGDFLKRIGVAESEFHLDDGCGLSKENTISPHAIGKVLSHHFYGKQRDAYMASLSIAGVDGTLEDRFRGSDLKGRVFGKSGYVNNVRSLSGYLKAKDGKFYAFSILINRAPEDPTIKLLQEKIVKAVDAHAPALATGGS